MDHPNDRVAPDDNATPVAPAPETASVFEDFIDIFYAPSQVFARRANGSFWPHFFIITLVSAGFMFASRSLTAAVFDAEFSRNMAIAMEKNPRLTEEMVSAQRGMMEGISSVGIYLATPILIVFVSVLIWVAAKVVGARLPFDRAVLVATIAQIPRLLGGLLTTLQAVLMTDTSGITSQHSIGYSPARFLDPTSMKPQLLNFVGRFDIFTLWVTFLLGVGVAVVGGVSRKQGLTAGAIAWGIASLVTVVSIIWS